MKHKPFTRFLSLLLVHRRQAPVDAVGGAGEAIVAGVAPTAAAQAAARAFGQVLMAAQVLDVDGAAAVQRGGAGGQGPTPEQ